jgi:hypothetical protein
MAPTPVDAISAPGARRAAPAALRRVAQACADIADTLGDAAQLCGSRCRARERNPLPRELTVGPRAGGKDDGGAQVRPAQAPSAVAATSSCLCSAGTGSAETDSLTGLPFLATQRGQWVITSQLDPGLNSRPLGTAQINHGLILQLQRSRADAAQCSSNTSRSCWKAVDRSCAAG